MVERWSTAGGTVRSMMSAEHAPFYEALAGASAALYGIGGGLVGSRLVALMERAAILGVEYGDRLNQGVSAQDNQMRVEWARRLRRDSLADLHELVRPVRAVVAWSMSSAVVLVLASLAPLGGLIDNTRPLRLMLGLLFVVSALVWVVLILRMADQLRAVTQPAYDQRRRERTDATARGEPFIKSGDPDQLRATAEGLAAAFPPHGIRGFLRRRWWKRKNARWRRPSV
jgi:hypothetical protein